MINTLLLIDTLDGSKGRKLGSRINETGSCITIDTRFLTIFLEWTVYKCFHFLLKIFQKERSIHNDFSYQKYINGSMATQREKTHIQYPNMYKLYVS